MQLSKKELAETQMIVTTPEKWDVITRKVSLRPRTHGAATPTTVAAQRERALALLNTPPSRVPPFPSVAC